MTPIISNLEKQLYQIKKYIEQHDKCSIEDIMKYTKLNYFQVDSRIRDLIEKEIIIKEKTDKGYRLCLKK